MVDAQMNAVARMGLESDARSPRANYIVMDEPEWCWRPKDRMHSSSRTRVIATRWRALRNELQEASAQTPEDVHLVSIVLRNRDCRFVEAGRTIVDGFTAAGMVHVTEPATPCRCLFRGPYDTLHLHVPNALIAECGRDMSSNRAPVLPSQPTMTSDPVVERLGRALLGAEEVGNSLGSLYADSISLAIVARLLSVAHQPAPSERPKVAALPKWRLKKALEYIEVRLAEHMSLADIASTTGLSCMHFAAQFKAAVGMRPHEYLLRRRIERAQEALMKDDMSLIDIALSVGFLSQSHFTTVFKRLVGQTPRAWRQSQAQATPVREQDLFT